MIALTAAALVVDAPRTASGEDEAACAVIDLGMLDDDMVGLSALGTWTTEDCDSRFRIDSDAHTYRFQHADGDRIRIDLVSADGDPYLMGSDQPPEVLWQTGPGPCQLVSSHLSCGFWTASERPSPGWYSGLFCSTDME